MIPPAPDGDRPARDRWYRGYVLGLAVVLAGALLARAVRYWDDLETVPLGYWLLAAMAIIADTPPFTLHESDGRDPRSRWEWPTAISASVCFTFAISLRWGGGATLIQVIAVVIGAAMARRPLWRTLFDVDRYGLAMLFAGAVFLSQDRPFVLSNQVTTVVIVVFAAIVWLVTFLGLSAVEQRLRARHGWWTRVRRDLGEQALSGAAILVLGVVVVDLMQRNPWVLPAVLIPLYAITRMVRLAYASIRRSRTDPLTGLANRTALAIEVGRQVRYRVERTGRQDAPRRFALVHIGLDRFRFINESLGHQTGDQVLVAVAERLVRVSRTAATAARVGGDEFCVLINQVADHAEANRQAAYLAAALSGPVDVDGVPLNVGCTAGVAVYPEHGADFATLLRHAGAAMYQAKDDNEVAALYRPERDPGTAHRLRLLTDLHTALTEAGNAEIGLYYQPQVALDSGDLVGVEALLRWRHPEFGLIDPAQAILVAEQSEAIRLLTQRVTDLALAQLARWRAAGLRTRVSVNASVHDLYLVAFADWVDQRLREHEVPADQLQLEITETALMTDSARVLPTLARLRERGVTLSLDDFGTGYSSLLHLRELPVTEIKIDKSFVARTVQHPGDEAVVQAIIDLAARLDLRVVAEGVENRATHELLREHGCAIGQGWYYARAMPPDALPDWQAARAADPRGRWTGRGRGREGS